MLFLANVHSISRNIFHEIFLQLLLLSHREHVIHQENQQHKNDNQRLTKIEIQFMIERQKKDLTERGFPCRNKI